MNIADKVGFKFEHTSDWRSDEQRHFAYSIRSSIWDGVICEHFYYTDIRKDVHINMEYVPAEDKVLDLTFTAPNIAIHIIKDEVVSGNPLSEQVRNELIPMVKSKLSQVKGEFGIEAKLAEYQSAESLRKAIGLL